MVNSIIHILFFITINCLRFLFFIQGNTGNTYANTYRDQPYQPNQFNGNEQFVPYEKYNQDQPQFSFDSVDTYVTPSKFNLPHPTAKKPQFSYGSAEIDVKPNAPQLLYSSSQSYSPPNSPQIPYGLPNSYVNPINPQILYGSTGIYPSTIKPQPLYGLTGTYVTSKKPELYESPESYATSSKPQLFYSSSEGYSSTIKPQYSYSSTETYDTTRKPEISYGPYGPSESYSTTEKPELLYGPYGPSESYSTTDEHQFPYNEANANIVPNQSSYRSGYYQFSRPLGILYHQQHDSEIGSQYHNGFVHQQNNFQSIPVNNNYDSHKNDIQYPPIRDFETHSTTQGPINKIPSARLNLDYPSNIYLNPSVPYAGNVNKNSYSILGGASGYDSRKVDEQYQPLHNFETYSTTLKPIVKLPEIPTYSQSNIYFEPTSKPFEEYSHGISHSSFNEEPKSQYYTTESPSKYSSPSSTNLNDYHISSTSQKPIIHDTSLYKEQFKSQFNFEDYLSRISSEQYPSSTPEDNYTPSVHGDNYAQTYTSTTTKPTVFYYTSPSPTLSPYKETSDIQSYSTPSNVKEYSGNYDSSISYPKTTEKPINYNLPISSTYDSQNYNPTVSPSAYTPTSKPTVDYYTPSSIVSNDDSIFVQELISKLSKAPISTTYSTSTPKPLYANYPEQPPADYIPNDSFDINEYIANLSESLENSTPKPVYSSTSYKPSDVPYSSSGYGSQPLPTAVYFSSTEDPKTFNQESYSALPVQSTTCKPEASIKISAPKIQYVPSLESVFSVKPPVTYTQKPEPLVGYSSTVSDLLNYYHNVHSSLDSAYRSPLPRYYSPPIGSSLYTNYTLPREYEKDAEHNIHAAYPSYPLQPIIVEPVSPELNAEFEKYYTAEIRNNLRSEDNGKVLVVGDTNPLLVSKLGAQCDCAKKKKPIIVSTTTRTVIETDEDEEDEKSLAVKEVETKTKVVLEEVKKPSNKKLCTRPGLFRDPKQCNKFYSCNWDKWTQKYALSEFKCPIHLSFDENLSACNWPSKGPACSHDKLINFTN